jgi:hypothetical protein
VADGEADQVGEAGEALVGVRAEGLIGAGGDEHRSPEEAADPDGVRDAGGAAVDARALAGGIAGPAERRVVVHGRRAARAEDLGQGAVPLQRAD